MNTTEVKAVVNNAAAKAFPGLKLRLTAHDRIGEGDDAIANVLQIDWLDGPTEEAMQAALSVDTGEWSLATHRTYSAEAIADVLNDLCKEFKFTPPALLPSATGGWRLSEDRDIPNRGSLESLVWSALNEKNLIQEQRVRVLSAGEIDRYKGSPMFRVAVVGSEFKSDSLQFGIKKAKWFLDPTVLDQLRAFVKKYDGVKDDAE